MLLQNDIPIDVVCHRYTLNMQVSSGTKKNSSPNEPSCTNITVSFNGVFLVVMGTWYSPYLSPARIRLQTKPGLVGKHHTRALLWCPQCMLSTPGQYYFRTILDRLLGARAAGVHYRIFSVWTLVPVRLDKQLSDHSTVDEIASGAADCRLTYTMANCPQRRLKKRVREKKRKGKEDEEKKEKSSEKMRAGRFRKRSGESQSFLFRDADQESKTRMRNNALRTGPRQAVE
ncbi:uncharacterized protein TNCV_4775161 [Trichonephila clavipes]|nr:uncharacterized protein TNCV_4775161 [Trichonephila clavipes]